MSAIERFRPGDAPDGGSSSSPSTRMPPVSPQMALRVAILGGIALVMFGVIFFRLWYLQVLTGEQYVQEAAANSVRDLPIAAPRGQILDREGQPIAASTVTNAVQIVPSALPPAGRPRLALYGRLGALLGMSAGHIEALVIKGRTALPYAPVTIKTDAGRGVLTVLAERQNEFPGVTQQPVSIRSYPYGRDGRADVLGYVGQVSKSELKLHAFQGVQQGTVVGQEGLEYYYDRYLRGRDGRAARAGQLRRLSRADTPAADAAHRRLQPEDDARSRSATRGGKGNARGDRKRARGRQTGPCGGVRGDEPAQRRSARDRLLPELRSEQVRQTADHTGIPGTRGRHGRRWRRRSSRTAGRSGDGRRLPDRLDVQADHGDGRPGRGRHQPERGPRRGPVHRCRRRAVLQRGPRRLRAGGAGRSAEGLLRHLLLHGWRARQQPRQRDPEQGPRTWNRPPDGDRSAQRDRPAPFPAGSGWSNRTRKNPSVSVHTTATRATSWPNRASRGPSATTWTWRSVRATCRPIPLQMAVAYSTLANAYLHGGDGDGRASSSGIGDRRIKRWLRAEPVVCTGPPRAPERRRPQPRDGRASTRPPASREAPPRTCGRAGTRNSTPSTARRAPPNVLRTWNSRGTCASSTIPVARS